MDVQVSFVHYSDGRIINVTLDGEMTGREVIQELVANDFVPSNDNGYNLALKGGHQLDNSKTLAENSIRNNDIIRVIPATDAGGGYYCPTDSVPGFDKASKQKFNIDELMNSPQSVHMIVHMYQDALEENKILYQKIDEKNGLLEVERLNSNNRLVSSILLVVSQIVIGIGCGIILTSQEIGLWVIIAGFAQSLLAIFLNLYKPKIRKI